MQRGGQENHHFCPKLFFRRGIEDVPFPGIQIEQMSKKVFQF
jgi:hypothetical protein